MAANPPPERESPRKLAPISRILIEVGFIVFLFYSNLLMGQYVVAGPGPSLGLLHAARNVFTEANLAIAVSSALIGFLTFECLRKRF
jgi:hypothetical protein